MRFWLGTHEPSWLARTTDLFVSRRRLVRQKSYRPAIGSWALDSGGFTELNLYGEWRTTEDEYVRDIRRYQEEIGHLAWVAPMDWMCEPFVLEKTGMSVALHQERTIDNFKRLRERLGSLVIPVLQGWDLDEYKACWARYHFAGVDLEREPLVGIGSVCRRQNTEEAAVIFRLLNDWGLRMHGFGIKTSGIQLYGDLLTSADSLAWSFRARRQANEQRAQYPEQWPRETLCGRWHPFEHKAYSCANCFEWATQWRDSITNHREAA